MAGTAELGTTGLVVAGALSGIGNALLGGGTAAPTTNIAAQEQANAGIPQNVWIIGGIVVAVVVGIVLLSK
jgi:hypothetical protein